MKKIILVAAVGMLALASCKKDYTCECVFSGGGVSGSSSELLENYSKSDAEDYCNEEITIGETTTKCEIK